MERFEDYWGAPAWLDKVTYKICENADALVMNLNGGSIDLCAHLTSAQASQLNQNFQVLEGTMNLVQAIYLNNQAKPFDNQLVRQALSLRLFSMSMPSRQHLIMLLTILSSIQLKTKTKAKPLKVSVRTKRLLIKRKQILQQKLAV